MPRGSRHFRLKILSWHRRQEPTAQCIPRLEPRNERNGNLRLNPYPQHDGVEFVEQFCTGSVDGVLPTWFHGMRARIMAMPQVSVIPANISPAPTKAERPAQ